MLKKTINLENFLGIASMVVTFLLMIVISSLLYSYSKDSLTSEMDIIHRTRLNQISSEVNSSLSQVVKVTNYLKNNRQLIKYISAIEDENTDVYEKVTLLGKVSSFLLNMKEYDSNIKSINILTSQDQYSSGDILFDYSMINELKNEDMDTITFEKGKGNPVSSELNDKTYNRYQIFDSHNHFKCSLTDGFINYGSVYIFLQNSFIKDKVNIEDNILVIDEDSNIIWRSNSTKKENDEVVIKSISNGLSDKLYGSGKSEIYVRQIDFNNWKIVYIADNSKFLSRLASLQKFMIFALLLSFVVTYVFSKLTSRRIVYPLSQLAKVMKDYKNKDKPIKHDSIKNNKLYFRERIFYYFFITIFVPTSLYLGILYFQSREIVTEQIKDGHYAVFSRSYNSIENYINNKKVILQRIAFNNIVQDFIQDKNHNNQNKTFFEEIIEKNIYLGLREDTISIYDNQNNLVFSNKIFGEKRMNEELFNEIKSDKTGVSWRMEEYGLGRYYLTLATPVIKLSNGLNSGHIGYIKLNIDFAHIDEQFKDLKTDNNNIFLTDRSGNNIYFSKEENLLDVIYDKEGNMIIPETKQYSAEKSLIFYEKVKAMPWNFFCIYNSWDVYSRSLTMPESNIIFMFVILFLLVVLISYVITIRLLKSINRLNKSFLKVGIDNEELKIIKKYSSIDEISTLGDAFNKMLERIEELIDEVIISNKRKNLLENEKKDAEIAALQAQINPHFLYNTLDTVNHMVNENATDKATVMINALSDLFRFGISRGEIVIPISEEIKYTKAYSEIMAIRYGNNIKFVWLIDNNMLKYKTIKLILQPLVENALHHGVRDKMNLVGNVTISCIDNGESISFIIADNGIGISCEELKNIRENFSNSRHLKKIGIYNVLSRLRLHYGEGYGLDIDSEYGNGTKVTVTIPKIV